MKARTPSQKGRAARRKGKDGELAARAPLLQLTGCEWERSARQSRPGGGKECPDLTCAQRPNLHPEVKVGPTWPGRALAGTAGPSPCRGEPKRTAPPPRRRLRAVVAGDGVALVTCALPVALLGGGLVPANKVNGADERPHAVLRAVAGLAELPGPVLVATSQPDERETPPHRNLRGELYRGPA